MKSKLLIFISCIFLSTVQLSAYNLGYGNIFLGARTAGMGDAFVAIADDANAIYFNPAGLAFQEKATFSIGNLLLDEDYKSVFSLSNYAVAYSPYKGLGVGLAYTDFSVLGFMNQSVLYASVAHKFGEVLSVGANLKNISEKQSSFFYYPDTSDSAVSGDIGILCKMDSLSMGMVLVDFLEPELTLTSTYKIERAHRVGIAMSSNGFNLAAEYQNLPGETSLMNFGVEYSMEPGIGLRLGSSTMSYQDPYSTDMTTLSVGLGIILNQLEFNYCIIAPYVDEVIEMDDKFDYISLCFRFDAIRKETDKANQMMDERY